MARRMKTMSFAKWKVAHKQVLMCGLGAAVGAIEAPLIRQYMPGVVSPDIPAPWGNNDVFWPCILGAGALGASFFVRKVDINSVLIGFGTVSLITGLLRGAFPEYGFQGRAATARAARPRLRSARPMVRRAANRASGVGPMTPTGIPPATVLA